MYSKVKIENISIDNIYCFLTDEEKEFLNKEDVSLLDLIYCLKNKVTPSSLMCKFCGKRIHAYKQKGGKDKNGNQNFWIILPKHCGDDFCKNESREYSILTETLKRVGLIDVFLLKEDINKDEIYNIIDSVNNRNNQLITIPFVRQLSKKSYFLSSLIKEFGIEDVRMSFSYNILLEHKYCPVCGNKLHINKKKGEKPGYQFACCRSCITKYYFLHPYEYFTKRHFNDFDFDLTFNELDINNIKIVLKVALRENSLNELFLKCLFNKNEELKKWIKDGLLVYDLAYFILNDIKIHHRFCLQCGKEIHLESGFYTIKLKDFCSANCAGIYVYNKKVKEDSSLLLYYAEKHRDQKKNDSYNNMKSLVEGKLKPLFSKEDWKGLDKEYKWECICCGSIFNKKIYSNSCPICANCNEYSNCENFVKIFIEENFNTKVVFNDRTAISPLEIDLFFPLLNKGIEVNGNYWHSIEVKDKEYHINKRLKAESCGISLLSIYEIDIINKPELVKNIISIFLSYNLSDSLCFSYNKEYINNLFFMKSNRIFDLNEHLLSFINYNSFYLKSLYPINKDLSLSYNNVYTLNDSDRVFLIYTEENNNIFIKEFLFDYDKSMNENLILFIDSLKFLFISSNNKDIFYEVNEDYPIISDTILRMFSFYDYKKNVLKPFYIHNKIFSYTILDESKKCIEIYNSGFSYYKLNKKEFSDKHISYGKESKN